MSAVARNLALRFVPTTDAFTSTKPAVPASRTAVVASPFASVFTDAGDTEAAPVETANCTSAPAMAAFAVLVTFTVSALASAPFSSPD